MKFCCILLVGFIASSFNSSHNVETAYYYFCVSRSADRAAEKESVLITSLKELKAGASQVKSLTNKWSALVKSKCENASGCTSDFNSYTTKATAIEQLEKAHKNYSDAKKFEVKIVEFE